jgi:uroporphyrinogen-III decarboxylase
MVEGSGSADFHTVKSMLYARPDLMHRILDINARSVAAYLNAQIEAGAQAVMIFDTWGGALADGVYQRFSLQYIEQVVSQLKRDHDGEKVPVITFTKGGGLWLDEIAETGVDAVGLDWTVNLRKARERVGGKVPHGSARGARQLRQSPGTRVQSRAWHFAVHAAGERCRTDRRSASAQPHDSQRRWCTSMKP